MNRVDELIQRTLSQEEAELLARHAEPGYLQQAAGLFRGPWSWVMVLVNAVVLLAFVAAVWSFSQLLQTTDAVQAVRWGVAGLVLLQLSVLGKSFMGQHLETNRVLRELKRLELRMLQTQV